MCVLLGSAVGSGSCPHPTQSPATHIGQSLTLTCTLDVPELRSCGVLPRDGGGGRGGAQQPIVCSPELCCGLWPLPPSHPKPSYSHWTISHNDKHLWGPNEILFCVAGAWGEEQNCEFLESSDASPHVGTVLLFNLSELPNNLLHICIHVPESP